MKIYVASSWRNECQQAVVLGLRALGHEVYDFKNPQRDIFHLASPESAMCFYRAYSIDMTYLQFEGMWWRVTSGGDC